MDEPRSRGYDTREGIARMIKTLWGLNRLLELRREAYYVRDELLRKWCVRGRWILDECGNAPKFAEPFIPAEMIPSLPDVVTEEELRGYIDRYVEEHDPPDGSVWLMTVGVSGSVPPANIVCYECGRPWTIDDCHDVSVRSFAAVLPLDGFAGKAFGEVGEIIVAEAGNREVHRVLGSIYRADIGDRVEGEDEFYVVKEGDQASLYVWRFLHKACCQVYEAGR